METLLQDLRYSLRSIARAPGFALVAVLTLALGMGATTAIFSAADAILLRPLPVPHPERLVTPSFTMQPPPGFKGMKEISIRSVAYPQYEALRDDHRGFSALAAWVEAGFEVGQGGEAASVQGAWISTNYFETFRVQPLRGSFAGAEDGVVLSEQFWARNFGRDPSIVGRTISVDGAPMVVAAVAPRGFTSVRVGEVPELWVPLTAYERLTSNKLDDFIGGIRLTLVGRLQPGVSPEQAAALLSATIQNASGSDGRSLFYAKRASLKPYSPVPDVRHSSVLGLFALLGTATALVLLIASVNVAGMLLARGAGRKKEIAVRLALGAGRGRVVRQLLTEGVLLFLLGGVAGVLLSVWMVQLLAAIHWPVPVSLEVGLNARMLGFALLSAAITGVGFGLAPALRASRPEFLPALQSAATNRADARNRLRSVFVVGQIALSLLLLVGAGLFLRSLEQGLRVDPGFDVDRVMSVPVGRSIPHDAGAAGWARVERVAERIRTLPGVERVAVTASGLLSPTITMISNSSGKAPDPALVTPSDAVGPDYFQTMGIPLLRGRGFTDTDREGTPRVVIVNEFMAHNLWPGEDPLGKQIGTGERAMTVVGVARDAKYRSLDEDSEMHRYFPLAQTEKTTSPAWTAHLLLRTRGDPAAVEGAVRRAIQEVDPTLRIPAITPASEAIAKQLFPQRVGTLLVGGFGLLGLLLAAVGIYGIMAYAVGQRTHEIGVRTALGADRRAVLALVIGHGMRLTALGIILGVVAALATTRLLSHLLFGISPTDPVTFAAAAIFLAAVALLASYLPARRAMRVDPVEALRAE